MTAMFDVMVIAPGMLMLSHVSAASQWIANADAATVARRSAVCGGAYARCRRMKRVVNSLVIRHAAGMLRPALGAAGGLEMSYKSYTSRGYRVNR